MYIISIYCVSLRLIGFSRSVVDLQMDHHRTPALQVQITQIDYSLDAPDRLDNSNLPNVPVLRIYGASSAGKKCCLHIHQVYPYFFVEYKGKMNPGSGEQCTRCF